MNNDVLFRQETPADYKKVAQVIEEAFANMPISDHTEQFLVGRLRKSEAFIPQLSIVAEINGEIVGHILLTKILIKKDNKAFESLSLAPVSVVPKYQKQGIGSKLIKKSHKTAKELGYQSIVVLGHPEYYPRFGYQKASKYGIKFPFDAPDESCMVIELIGNALKNVSGKVVFPKEFFV